MNKNPAHPVFEQCLRTPDRLALAADGLEIAYDALAARASRLAGALAAQGVGRGSRVGIFGSRSRIAVEAVLGIAWAGAAYVPLGLGWPAGRMQAVLDRIALDALLVDRRGLAQLTPAMLAAARVLIVPDAEAARTLPADPRRVTLALDARVARDAVLPPVPMAGDDLVYVIFTSGTTGVPKGVMAPAGAVAAYLSALAARKAMTPADRASQFTELTFDPSLGEIFVPWYAGASLHVVPALAEVSPARFIRDHALTIWGSAPAAIAWMQKTRSLAPGSLPGLRYSSFGGEPLPLASVRAWQAAAPHSVIDNLYGPTEATVDCAGQRVEPGATPIVSGERGVLAIGTAHPGTELAVFGPDRRPLADGETGELAIAGLQLTQGYLGEPELTHDRFPVIAGRRWYLTGDLARRDAAGNYHHLGRIDHQIKIHGHRVELEDIEAHLRAVSGSAAVAAVPWPVVDGVAQGIVGFVADSAEPAARLREALRLRLPAHMVPAAIHALEAIPLNVNGKLDRAALAKLLSTGDPHDDERAGG